LQSPNSNLSGVGVASIARNAVYLVGSQLLEKPVRLIYAIALAHYLGPELFGLINYGISWYLSFLSLTGLGIAVVLSREIGRERNAGARIVSLTLTLRCSTAVIAAAACAIFGWFFESKPEVRIVLIVFSIALVGRSLAIWTGAVFNAYELNRVTFRIQTIFRTFEVFVGTAVLIAGGGATAVAVLHAISWWLQALVGLELTRRRLVAIRLNWSWHGLKYIVLQGIPLGLGFVMVNWLQSGPLVLLRHFGSSENSLGQLALAMQSLAIIGSAFIAVGMASLPVLSRSVARQDGKEFLYAEIMIRAGLIFGSATGLAGLGAGPWLVDLIFGSRYLEAGYLLGPVMWLPIPLICAATISRLYNARGEFFVPTVCSGVGALIMTLIMPWCIAAMNTLGAVLATATGMAVWALSLICLLAKSGDIDVRQAIFRPFVIIFSAIGVFLALKSVNSWLALLISWAALFFGTLLFGGITEDERQLFRRLKRGWSSFDGGDSKQPGT